MQADADKKAKNGDTAAEKPGAPAGQNARNEAGPTPGKGAATPPAQSSGQTSAARVSAGTPERSRSYEESQKISPLTARPEGGTGAPVPELRAQDRGQSLPLLPFFRLLSGKQPSEALLDPETVTIILEAYPGKYRSHLEAFLKALQSRREKKSGS